MPFRPATPTVPPTTVEIIDHSPGARIQARETEEIVLQCLVRNAKPAADIVWLKRNQEIKFGKSRTCFLSFSFLSLHRMEPAGLNNGQRGAID
jgi:hypothetical protein